MTGDPVRDEADRLVAAAVAALSLAARGLGGVAGGRRAAGHSGFATGSAECCVCPVCRVISAMRDPSPDIAERLASGAGDIASAVTGVLRTLSRAGALRPHPPEREGDEFWDSLGRRARGESTRPRAERTGRTWPGEAGPQESDEDPWRAATRTPPSDDVLGSELSDHDLLDDAMLDGDVPPRIVPPLKKMAKKAVKKTAPKPPPPPTTPMAKKALKKAVPAAAPPPEPATAKKTAKKVAKKAAKKATPGEGQA